ncbi:DHHC palmitoyltransferase-domain-containing protein [Limtongia smithiae]|uniref:DHHC palmitoyltransferase-domain-containing protein n=1 Tax=Limtongia smithiae TaxID=1125753 RepID=UPI0034CD141D
MVYQPRWRAVGVLIPAILIALLGYGGEYFIFRKHMSPSALKRHRIYLHLVWFTYALAVTRPPGRPPTPTVFEAMLKSDPDLRQRCTFCRKCNAIKPPRAHHCRLCKTCVLRMDHHCPWTNNCVGHRNLLHYLRFLGTATLATLSAFVNLCSRVTTLWQARHRSLQNFADGVPITTSEIVATIILTPVALFLLFSLSLLFIRTLWNNLENTTQIETWEKERVEGQVRRGRLPDIEFPYDLGGPFENLCESLGPPWMWFFPWSEPDGDGMHFKTIDDSVVVTWPPPDPDEVAPHLYADTPAVPRTPLRPRTSTFQFLNEDEDRDYYNDSEPDEGTDENSYWRRDKWQSWEGERLEDFGVDAAAEAPLEEATPVEGTPESKSSAAPATRADDDEVPLGVIKRNLTHSTGNFL